jgi:transcriptional repressor NrdR
MKCPKCGYKKMSVVDSRVAKGGATQSRARKCPECGYRCRTHEIVIKKQPPMEAVLRAKMDRAHRFLSELVEEDDKRRVDIEI